MELSKAKEVWDKANKAKDGLPSKEVVKLIPQMGIKAKEKSIKAKLKVSNDFS